MNQSERELVDADLMAVAMRLRDEVPKATPLELDRIKLRAKAASASRGRATRRGEWMRSRIAVTTMLVVGFLISGTGGALAVSGISGAGSAGEHQYPVQAVGGEQASGGGNAGGNQSQAQQGTEAATQAARQVAVTGGGGGLPFTGFVAIPLLLVGVGLTAAGFAFRRAGARQH
jgi:hypothetical protein